MQANYDADLDVLRIRWSDAHIEESDQEQPGIILDYDKDGNIIGLEVLNASKRIDNAITLPQLLDNLQLTKELMIIDNDKPLAQIIDQASTFLLERPGPGLCKDMITVIADDDAHLEYFAEYITIL